MLCNNVFSKTSNFAIKKIYLVKVEKNTNKLYSNETQCID